MKKAIKGILLAWGALYLATLLGYGCIQNAQVAGVCDEHGYPEHKMTFNWFGSAVLPGNFTGYCFKRVNGTDVMIPTEDWE